MRLLISCPNCGTSYQISEEQLQESDGQARCFHCQSVFNAALNSQPLPDDAAESHPELADHFTADESDFSLQYSNDLSEINEQDLSSLFQQDANSEILSGPEDERLGDSSMMLPEELLDIELDDKTAIEPLTIETVEHTPEPTKAPTSLGTAAWMIGSLLLVVLFIVQAAWLYRDTLLLNSQIRDVFETVCQGLPCKLPPRRDPDAFKVADRTVSIHPEVEGILSINMLFTNAASFAQPAPGITLSLYNNQQRLISRRSFTHREYLLDDSRKPPMLAAGHTQKISINLEDPGPDVTGFEFTFY